MASLFSNVLRDIPEIFIQSRLVFHPGGAFGIPLVIAEIASRIDFSFDDPEVLDIEVFVMEFDERETVGPVVARGIVG